jgi:hypothetical protein
MHSSNFWLYTSILSNIVATIANIVFLYMNRSAIQTIRADALNTLQKIKEKI